MMLLRSIIVNYLHRAKALAAPILFAGLPLSASAVVPNDNHTPESLIDDARELTGIGVQFTSFGQICTGTLINPRTVLFAAHCDPAADFPGDAFSAPYSLDAGMAFGFEGDASDAYDDWFNSGHDASDPSRSVFQIDQIHRHPDYINNDDGQNEHPNLAIAVLETPALNVPSQPLLFSPLAVPALSDPASGTGLHVNIIGYGESGSGTEGQLNWTGNTTVRRMAENTLGGLTDLPANWDRDPAFYYLVDFDDPAQSSPYDVDKVRDPALPGEGIAGFSDHGGPLILDARNNAGISDDVTVGILSIGHQSAGGPTSGYGTFSRYVPLFLHWEWIVQANPYRYVAATPGSTGARRDWEDPAIWQTLIDPNFRTLDAAQTLVNALPANPGAGQLGDGPGFGQICNDPHPRDGAPASPQCESAANDAPEIGWWPDQDLPAPTLANGLPGASNFTPNNITPDRALDIAGRYFDVSLSEPGIIELRSEAEIDQLTLTGQASLDVKSLGTLFAETAIVQHGVYSFVSVDGALETRGSYDLRNGWLFGHGTISATQFINREGILAPGAPGAIGALELDASVILNDQSYLLIDVSNTQIARSDRLIALRDLEMGGKLLLSGPLAAGDQFTLIEYDGVASGAFDAILEVQPRGPLARGELAATIVDTGSSIELHIAESP